MKLSNFTIVLCLAVLGSVMPIRSAASPDPTLLKLNWFVHFCKDLDSAENCIDNRKLKPATRFGLRRDRNNDYWLDVQLKKPNKIPAETLMELSIPIEEIEWINTQGQAPEVRFSFSDFDDTGNVALKTMSITLLRDAGQSTTGESCEQSLQARFGEKLPEAERDQQCQARNRSVVHWRIRPGSLAPVSGEDTPMSSLGPPGDSQGSGSDEPPQ